MPFHTDVLCLFILICCAFSCAFSYWCAVSFPLLWAVGHVPLINLRHLRCHTFSKVMNRNMMTQSQLFEPCASNKRDAERFSNSWRGIWWNNPNSSAIQVFGHKFQVDLPSVSSCDSHCGHCSARMHSGKAVLSKHFIVTKFQYKFYIHFVVYYCRESNLYYTWFIQWTIIDDMCLLSQENQVVKAALYTLA